MTSITASSPTSSVVTERQRVLDDLNLSMLFLEAAHVETVDAAEDFYGADADRLLRLRVRAHRPLTPAGTAALLCRLLHNRRIPNLEIDRIAGGVRLRCSYLLPTTRWWLDITAPIH